MLSYDKMRPWSRELAAPALRLGIINQKAIYHIHKSLKNLKSLKNRVFRNFLGPFVSGPALFKNQNAIYHIHMPFLPTYPIIGVLTYGEVSDKLRESQKRLV